MNVSFYRCARALARLVAIGLLGLFLVQSFTECIICHHLRVYLPNCPSSIHMNTTDIQSVQNATSDDYGSLCAYFSSGYVCLALVTLVFSWSECYKRMAVKSWAFQYGWINRQFCQECLQSANYIFMLVGMCLHLYWSSPWSSEEDIHKYFGNRSELIIVSELLSDTFRVNHTDADYFKNFVRDFYGNRWSAPGIACLVVWLIWLDRRVGICGHITADRFASGDHG